VERGEFSNKDALINAHLPLVIAVAKNYRDRGLDYMELIQEGSMGLQRAVEVFDYRRGHRLSTYARWKIEEAILKAIAEKGRLIRLPREVLAKIGRINRARARLARELGREPTRWEIAEFTGFEPHEVDNVHGWAQAPASLEAPINGDDGGAPLVESLHDESAEMPFESVAANSLRSSVRAALGCLTSRERRIIELRFGLGEEPPQTLEAIGRRLDVTRERVRQIQTEALEKLARVSVAYGWHDALT
jgi:RNA polymerase primary sigma factor